MRLSRQVQACLFIYLFIYFTKIFWGYKKHQNSKQTILTLWEVFMRVKTVAFVVFCSLILVFVGWFCLICVFERSISFRKNKNKLALNCPDSLNLLCHWRVALSTHLSSLYLHRFVLLCNHLWESFWISSYLW